MPEMSYRTVPLGDILFFDIETVSNAPRFDDLSDRMKAQSERKSGSLGADDDRFVTCWTGRAAIPAVFGRIVCISVGVLTGAGAERTLRVKSFHGAEEEILKGFSDLLSSRFSHPTARLCGHNIKEFDVPYVCRRMLVHGLPLPRILDIPGLKPWETQFLDTMQLWKFGDFKAYTSLDLLTAVFGIPTPKEDMEGAMVGYVFWHDQDVERIVRYCENDVLAVANLLLRLRGEPILPADRLERAS